MSKQDLEEVLVKYKDMFLEHSLPKKLTLVSGTSFAVMHTGQHLQKLTQQWLLDQLLLLVVTSRLILTQLSNSNLFPQLCLQPNKKTKNNMNSECTQASNKKLTHTSQLLLVW